MSSQQIPRIPLKDFFRKPKNISYRLSPNGKYLSYLAPYQNRLNIFVRAVGSEEVNRITNDTQRDIRSYFWANDNRILYLQDTGGDENFRLYVADIHKEDVRCLTDFPDVKTQIIDQLVDIESELIIGLNKRNPQVFDPYRLNIETGELSLLAQNPGNISGWLTDHNGKLRVAVATDGVNTSILYREKEEEAFQTVFTSDFKDSLSPMFFCFDNQHIYALSNLGRDTIAVVEWDPNQAKEIKIIYENPSFDIQHLSYSRKRKCITHALYTSWKQKRHFFDPETEELITFLEAQLPNREIGIMSRTSNEDKLIVRTYSDRSMGAYYYFDVSSKALTKIADISPWLEESHLAEIRPIQYTSRDGMTIHGYLTLPNGAEPKNLPVIINPHGGPWARDNWGFIPEVQFLANRGYAIMRMNFRGSAGYGKAFLQASFKEWGKKMQDDITDGVHWLIKEGIADKDRIAIYGGSYGGYATLSGLTFTPELYACGVDYVGVSNLFTFLNSIPSYWEPFREMFYEMIGHPEADYELLYSSSPVFHVDKIKAPLLIAQGANDPRVKKEESDQMVEALQKRGINITYIIKDNEGHGFVNQENQFEFYRAMEEFLASHLS